VIAQVNNVENEILSLWSAIQATTVSVNAMENMFRKTEPIGVGSRPTSVDREMSVRHQLVAGARQRVELQAMLGDLDFGHQVTMEDVLKAVRLVQETDSFLRQKSRSPSP
jgi:hypothetical protein